jgi:hypothetical protein
VDKYNRNYVLLIQKKDGTTLRITRPFTVEFDIHRNSLSSANVCQLRVYNLSPDNRSQIRKDQYDFGDLRTIAFQAGYGDRLSLAFYGNITQAWSVREGNNMITQIECFDGGYAYVNAVTNDQFPKNTPQRSIIDSLVSSLPSVSRGAIGNYPGQISRGNSYSGNTTDVLGELTGGGFFIDNGKANCLNDNECIETAIPLINSASGLLGTPVLEAQYINIEMLFEPSLRVGQLIRLETATIGSASQGQVEFNGNHKVLSIKHRGIISEAVSGSAISQIGLLPGSFTSVPEAL